MLPIETQSYSSVLRLKEGECKSFSELPSVVCDRIIPHFILPPPQDRDPELKRVLQPNEIMHTYARRIGTCWPYRTCLVDPRFLLGAIPDIETKDWLPQFFKFATTFEARTIPVATLADLEGSHSEAFRKVIDQQGHGLAIRLTIDDLNRADLAQRTHKLLLKIVMKPSECVLILDFSDADLTITTVAAEVIIGAYQSAMEIGLWQRTLFQATSYPEKNPALPNSSALLARSDWLAWLAAIRLDRKLKDNLCFGDFGADSAKFVFKSGAPMPIRHYRYSTKDSWLVVRGDKNITAHESMRRVALRLTESIHFAGRNFSKADASIEDTRDGLVGPGNASTWRKLNTTHHLTRVVCDLAEVHGYEIPQAASTSRSQQHSLF